MLILFLSFSTLIQVENLFFNLFVITEYTWILSNKTPFRKVQFLIKLLSTNQFQNNNIENCFCF